MLRRERQIILVVRETITSYTKARIIESEKRNCLKETLISLCMNLHPLAVVCTDAASGFVALVDDSLMREHHICIEIGRVKNINKNLLAEKAIQEFEGEIVRHDATSGSITVSAFDYLVSLEFTHTQSWTISQRDDVPKRSIY